MNIIERLIMHANHVKNDACYSINMQLMREAAEEISRLRAENAALTYSLQLDEELIGMLQKIVGVLNNRPVQTPDDKLRGQRSCPA